MKPNLSNICSRASGDSVDASAERAALGSASDGAAAAEDARGDAAVGAEEGIEACWEGMREEGGGEGGMGRCGDGTGDGAVFMDVSMAAKSRGHEEWKGG